MSTDQQAQLAEAQQKFDTFAKSVDWWMQCPDCGGEGQFQYMVQVPPDGAGEARVGTCHCVSTEGRILRYPHLFEAVFDECLERELHLAIEMNCSGHSQVGV